MYRDAKWIQKNRRRCPLESKGPFEYNLFLLKLKTENTIAK